MRGAKVSVLHERRISIVHVTHCKLYLLYMHTSTGYFNDAVGYHVNSSWSEITNNYYHESIRGQ